MNDYKARKVPFSKGPQRIIQHIARNQRTPRSLTASLGHCQHLDQITRVRSVPEALLPAQIIRTIDLNKPQTWRAQSILRGSMRYFPPALSFLIGMAGFQLLCTGHRFSEFCATLVPLLRSQSHEEQRIQSRHSHFSRYVPLKISRECLASTELNNP
jgi:hypothetical protein